MSEEGLHVDYEEIKQRMKRNDVLNSLINDMVSDGLSEDEAIVLMINAFMNNVSWLRWNVG